jgi:hypothetical protein
MSFGKGISDMTENETDRQPEAPREGGSRLRKWTRRVLLGLVGLVVFVLLAGVLYQFVATKTTHTDGIPRQAR